VLYELLTGELPFKGEQDAALAYGIVNTDPPPLPSELAALQPIVTRAFAKSPPNRYQKAAEIIQDLNRTRTGETTSAAEDKKGWWLRLTVFIAVVAVVGWIAMQRMNGEGGTGEEASVATRSARPPATSVAMSQVTFATGTEEFPALSPDGTKIAFCADDENGLRQVLVRDIASGQQTTVTTGRHDHIVPVWSPSGESVLFVRARVAGNRLEPGDVFGSYDGGDIWARAVDTGEETRMVENACTPALSPDGEKLAFEASWGGARRIYVADHRGRNPLQITTDSTEAAAHLCPRWSRDGSKIVFQWKQGTRFDIQVVGVDSHEQLWITNDLFQDVNPVWDPAADVVYFSSTRTGGLNIWRVAVDERGAPAGRLEQVTTGPGHDVQLAFSPNGSRLAFTVKRQNADLYALPVSPNTGKPNRPPYSFESTTREDSRGSWSSDGRSIAFNTDRSGHMNIWVKSAGGGSARQTTKGPGGDYQPEWSPDDRRLVFFSSRDGNADIWDVHVETGQLRQLTSDASLDLNPSYSPDGRWIAFQSDSEGRMELWLMNADGGEQRPLTAIGATGHFLLWMSDSDRIIFSSRTAGGSDQYVVTVSTGATDRIVDVAGGAHMSFSPDESLILDVVGHKAIWVTPLAGGEPTKVFWFEEPDDRIDYPRWSPDGRLVMFDRVKPSGADIWMLEGL
jgi:TolB protein